MDEEREEGQTQRRRVVLLVKEPKKSDSDSSSASEDGDPYGIALREAGYEAIYLPVLAHRLTNIPELRRIIESGASSHYSGLVFTSQRAVEAWKEAWTGVADPESLNDPGCTTLPFYTVGPATAAALQRLPGHAVPSLHLILGAQEAGNAIALADFVSARHRQWLPEASSSLVRPLLYLVGDKTKDTLSNQLGKASIPLEELQVYETYPSPQLEQDIQRICHASRPAFDWIVLFSPSGAKLVLPHFSKESLPKLAAIGPTTRDYLVHTARVSCDAMADAPNPASLVKALQAADFSDG